MLFQRKRHHLFPCTLEAAKVPPGQNQTAAISQLIWTNENRSVCPNYPIIGILQSGVWPPDNISWNLTFCGDLPKGISAWYSVLWEDGLFFFFFSLFFDVRSVGNPWQENSTQIREKEMQFHRNANKRPQWAQRHAWIVHVPPKNINVRLREKKFKRGI